MFKILLVVLNALMVLALSSTVFADSKVAGNSQEMATQSEMTPPAAKASHRKCHGCNKSCSHHKKHHKKMKKSAPKAAATTEAPAAAATDMPAATDAPAAATTEAPKEETK